VGSIPITRSISLASVCSTGHDEGHFPETASYHGHGAGTTLGMWDSQEDVPHTGDYPLHLDTAYSIELNAATFSQEWGKEIRIMLEEDAYFDRTGINYIDGRQTKLILIPR
jgi:hypothetical protein